MVQPEPNKTVRKATSELQSNNPLRNSSFVRSVLTWSALASSSFGVLSTNSLAQDTNESTITQKTDTTPSAPIVSKERVYANALGQKFGFNQPLAHVADFILKHRNELVREETTAPHILLEDKIKSRNLLPNDMLPHNLYPKTTELKGLIKEAVDVQLTLNGVYKKDPVTRLVLAGISEAPGGSVGAEMLSIAIEEDVTVMDSAVGKAFKDPLARHSDTMGAARNFSQAVYSDKDLMRVVKKHFAPYTNIDPDNPNNPFSVANDSKLLKDIKNSQKNIEKLETRFRELEKSEKVSAAKLKAEQDKILKQIKAEFASIRPSLEVLANMIGSSSSKTQNQGEGAASEAQASPNDLASRLDEFLEAEKQRQEFEKFRNSVETYRAWGRTASKVIALCGDEQTAQDLDIAVNVTANVALAFSGNPMAIAGAVSSGLDAVDYFVLGGRKKENAFRKQLLAIHEEILALRKEMRKHFEGVHEHLTEIEKQISGVQASINDLGLQVGRVGLNVLELQGQVREFRNDISVKSNTIDALSRESGSNDRASLSFTIQRRERELARVLRSNKLDPDRLLELLPGFFSYAIDESQHPAFTGIGYRLNSPYGSYLGVEGLLEDRSSSSCLGILESIVVDKRGLGVSKDQIDLYFGGKVGQHLSFKNGGRLFWARNPVEYQRGLEGALLALSRLDPKTTKNQQYLMEDCLKAGQSLQLLHQALGSRAVLEQALVEYHSAAKGVERAFNRSLAEEALTRRISAPRGSNLSLGLEQFLRPGKRGIKRTKAYAAKKDKRDREFRIFPKRASQAFPSRSGYLAQFSLDSQVINDLNHYTRFLHSFGTNPEIEADPKLRATYRDLRMTLGARIDIVEVENTVVSGASPPNGISNSTVAPARLTYTIKSQDKSLGKLVFKTIRRYEHDHSFVLGNDRRRSTPTTLPNNFSLEWRLGLKDQFEMVMYTIQDFLTDHPDYKDKIPVAFSLRSDGHSVHPKVRHLPEVIVVGGEYRFKNGKSAASDPRVSGKTIIGISAPKPRSSQITSVSVRFQGDKNATQIPELRTRLLSNLKKLRDKHKEDFKDSPAVFANFEWIPVVGFQQIDFTFNVDSFTKVTVPHAEFFKESQRRALGLVQVKANTEGSDLELALRRLKSASILFETLQELGMPTTTEGFEVTPAITRLPSSEDFYFNLQRAILSGKTSTEFRDDLMKYINATVLMVKEQIQQRHSHIEKTEQDLTFGPLEVDALLRTLSEYLKKI